MGKEVAEVRPFQRRALPKNKFVQFGLPQGSVAQQWNNTKVPISLSEIKEDGQAIVTMRTRHFDTTVMWSGISNEGNTYTKLITLFQTKGWIGKLDKVKSFSILKDEIWQTVGSLEETFNSGSKILMVLEDLPLIKQSKAIKKNKK